MPGSHSGLEPTSSNEPGRAASRCMNMPRRRPCAADLLRHVARVVHPVRGVSLCGRHGYGKSKHGHRRDQPVTPHRIPLLWPLRRPSLNGPSEASHQKRAPSRVRSRCLTRPRLPRNAQSGGVARFTSAGDHAEFPARCRSAARRRGPDTGPRADRGPRQGRHLHRGRQGGRARLPRPGELLGEVSTIEDRPRSATVIAVEAVSALALASGDFWTLLDEHPRIWVSCTRSSSAACGSRTCSARSSPARTRSGASRAGSSSSPTPTAARRDDGVTITLPLSQEELAGWTGSSREAVTKALRTLRELGWIETGRREISVRDREALRRFARPCAIVRLPVLDPSRLSSPSGHAALAAHRGLAPPDADAGDRRPRLRPDRRASGLPPASRRSARRDFSGGVAPNRRNAIKVRPPTASDPLGCPNKWKTLGVRIVAADFGGGPPARRSTPIRCSRSPARSGSTERGLKIGDSLDRVRARIPSVEALPRGLVQQRAARGATTGRWSSSASRDQRPAERRPPRRLHPRAQGALADRVALRRGRLTSRRTPARHFTLDEARAQLDWVRRALARPARRPRAAHRHRGPPGAGRRLTDQRRRPARQGRRRGLRRAPERRSPPSTRAGSSCATSTAA